jgi:uncharacterized membrane protein
MAEETGKPVAKKPSGRKQKPEDAGLRLWTTHREESVYFQREAQVNFWTVLGGLAMAALLTQLSPLLEQLRQGRWYLALYLVASILVIASSWVQTSWGSLVLKWPISIISTVIVLFEMLAQSIQCLLVTYPSGWLAACSGIIFFALVVQVYFAKSGAWQAFSPASIKRFRFTNWIYLSIMLICLAGAFQLFRYPSQPAEMVWGFVVLSFSVAALYMQNRGMQEEKKELGIP